MANLTVDIGNGFYQSDSLPFANQRCVNLYPNFPQAPAVKSSSLFEAQGIREALTTSRRARDRNRGGWVFNGVPYFVNGSSLWAIQRTVNFDESVTYDAIKVGEVDGEGPCSFADNGTQLIIINSSGDGYIYQPTAVPQFEAITAPGFTANGTPQHVVFVDSYFIVTTDEKVAIVSAPNDGKSWNALDFISAEADPDAVVAPFVFRNQLYLLGTQTTETYRNIGGAGVPFQRINGFVLSQGCSAPDSVRVVGDAVFWIGKGENQQPVVYQFTGNQPVKVSTTAIDNFLHDLSENELASAYSWAYSLRGHQFVAFTLNSFTFVYDMATQKWHERSSSVRDNVGNRIDKQCRIRTVLNAYNELIVGDTEDGRIGVIDVDMHKEYDEPLISYFTTSPLYDLGNSYSLPYIELVMENGVGNPSVPNPEVRLAISRDGALFENPRTRYIGASGDRKARCIWYKNGRCSRLSVFKFTISDAVKRRLFAVELKYKQGDGL